MFPEFSARRRDNQIMSVNDDDSNKAPDSPTVTNTDIESDTPLVEALDDTNKSSWERSWPVITCGAGLFSDGYLNGVRGFSSTILRWHSD